MFTDFGRRRFNERFSENRLTVAASAMMRRRAAPMLVIARRRVVSGVVSDVACLDEVNERLDAFPHRRHETVDDEKNEDRAPHGGGA